MHLTDPAQNAVPVTPSDDNALPHLSRGLYVGTGGDLVIEMANKQEVTFIGVFGGSLLPIQANKVKAATTATDIVSLY